MYELTLYIVGGGKGAEKSVTDLTKVLQQQLRDRYSLKVVDLLEQPELAERDNIFATPTVVKTVPLPITRIIGDLSDSGRVLAGLGLAEAGSSQPCLPRPSVAGGL
jgi:circadian clock protein KaiB